ncbi:LptA/OstA family protein [Aestuariispira ectoiniformans]|uniref:LptA/OstA family protein n=1 Tax=Aestuariispira ectoiniformans TaxID=2775080 RepID=UPI00223BA160|nr:LptA/OstA family protein [Aestuariispira ectoiniformans]
MKSLFRLLLLLVSTAWAAGITTVASAQTATNSSQEIQIEADDGIEWIRDKTEGSGEYRARGNAHATQGELQVYADELVAYYRAGANDKQQMYRMDALGNVRIVNTDTTAVGDKGVYHMDKQVIVLVGNNLKLTNPKAIITARDSLEYWQVKNIAVARGDALVTQEDKRLQAGVLTAFIQPNISTGKNEVKRIDATKNVHISTPTEIIRGQEGVYEVDRQVATLCGSVKITRGENQLNGECAEVNMKTGRSKLKGGTGRVKGLLIPDSTGN